MVPRTTTTTLLLLALALAAPAAHAEEIAVSFPEDPVDMAGMEGQYPNCNIARLTLAFPFVELHPECLV